MPAYATSPRKHKKGRTSLAQKTTYFESRRQGHTMTDACELADISPPTGRKWEREWLDNGGEPFEGPKGPIPFDKLSPEAKRALKSFEYFQRRYLGRIAVGWQKENAERIIALKDSDNTEFVVINVAPGAGKSTTLVAICLWLIVRERHIRILYGSYSQRMAEFYTDQIRELLTLKYPLKADPKDIEKGIAVDAESTIEDDFGRFNSGESIWRREQFYVEQFQGFHRVKKEATVQAFGMDTNFIGGRYDVCIWDDVYDEGKLASWEQKEKQRKWWMKTAQTRVDPRGVCVLQGQRLDVEDIYHFALEMTAGEFEEDDDGNEILPESGEMPKLYQHIKYPAHFEDRCAGDPKMHRKDAPAYPEGCLLFPKNIPWTRIKAEKANNPEFELLYQQEQINPVNVLVDPLWVSGGRGKDGVEYPGCWDKDRYAGELPPGMTMMDCVSLVSVDPSPSKWWAVQHWVYHGPTQQYFLIDLLKERMPVTKFLDWNHAQSQFVGVMEEWWQRSVKIGARITHLVVEINAAQNFMVQYDHMQRWLRERQVLLIPHATNKNKTDKETGVQLLQPEFMHGRIRLPGNFRDDSRLKAMKLIEEVTRYQLDKPDGGIAVQDQLMSAWFARLNISKVYRPSVNFSSGSRPSWVTGQRRFGVVA